MNNPALMELAPCPFCGSTTPRVVPPTCNRKSPYIAGDCAFPRVRCDKCYAHVGGQDWDESCVTAIDKWNTRTTPAHWHDLYRKEAQLRQDDAARYGGQLESIVALEGELFADADECESRHFRQTGYEIDFEYKGRAFAYLDAAERLNKALAPRDMITGKEQQK